MQQPPIPKFRIDLATEADIPAIQAIYAYHVINGLGSFEEMPPTVEEMQQRFSKIVKNKFPFLTAKIDDIVIGYGYCGPFRERSAYQYTVEDSIYIANDYQNIGAGKALLKNLIRHCENGPWTQILALIGDSNNLSSINLHKSLGFELTGTLKNIGFKHNQWLDVVFMQYKLHK